MQISEIEITELGDQIDDVIMCTPHSIECDQTADAWWVSSCCGKKYALCWVHELQADSESSDMTKFCLVCQTRYTEVVWSRFPI